MRKQLLGSSAILTAALLAAVFQYTSPNAYGQLVTKGMVAGAPGSVLSVPGEIIIKVPATMSDSDVAALAGTVNCTVLRPIVYSPHYYVLAIVGSTTKAIHPRGHVRSAGIPPTGDVLAAVAALKATSGIAASPNYILMADTVDPATAPKTPKPITRAAPLADGPLPFFNNDPLFYPSVITTTGQQWDMDMINAPLAWAIQSNAAGRTIIAAVLDTGLDITHPDLAANVLPNGMDFTPLEDTPVGTPTTTITDPFGHGTHVSGTVAAIGNNGIGVTGVGGMNRNGVSIKILPVRVLDADGGGTDETILSGINYAVTQNADVINMSLGGGPYLTAIDATTDPLGISVEAAIAAGTTVVAAAGNSSIDTGVYFFYPAQFPGVISVAAVGPQRELSFFSDYGNGVTLAAPGGDDPTFADPSKMILSTLSRDPAAQEETILSGYPVSPILGYGTDMGTSQATPHVAGAVALLLAAGAARNPATITSILQKTAQAAAANTPDASGGTVLGAGILDVYAAVASVTTVQPQFTAQFAEIVDQYYVPIAASGKADESAGFSAVSNEAYTQRGTTYVKPVTPFAIRFVGAPVDSSGKSQPGYVTVQITPATIPTSILRSYSGGTVNSATTFVLPAVPTGSSITTPLEVNIPPTVGLVLPDGQYRAALEVYDPTAGTTTEQGAIFFNTASQTEPAGRSMFASPFLVSSSVVGTLPPELFEFGANTNFTLARYNAQRLPTDLDYATYSPLPNATQNTQAEFVSPHAADGTPLATYTSDSTTSVQPIGLGFWLDLTDTVTLNPTGPVATQAVSVKLFAANGGWNMVGTPFTYPINWAAATVIASNGTAYSLDGAVTAGVINPTLVGYSGGEYVYSIEPAGTLEPFNGYWVQTLQDCTLVLTPTSTSKAQPIVGASNTVARTQLPAINGWRARISASVAGDHDGENYFGIINDKSMAPNRYDILKPPSGAGHAYVRFVKPDSTGKQAWYAEDLRTPASPTATTQWTAAVSTDKSASKVTLSWDSIGNAPRNAEVYLTDTATGKKISMRSRSQYTFQSGEAGSTRQFTISVAEGLSSGPLAVSNFLVVPPTRAVRVTGFRFTANQTTDVTGMVRSLNGKVIANIGATATRAEGSNETVLHWNGKKDDGTAVPAGLYFVEVTITNAKGEQATVKRPFTTLF